MDTLTDTLSIMERTTYVSGYQYGSMKMYNIARSKHGVMCLITKKEEVAFQTLEWRSKEFAIENTAFEKIVNLIKSENLGLVSNYKETDDPLDYQMHYYINGTLDGVAISLKVEQVLGGDAWLQRGPPDP